jgi:hypothetical protein
MYFFNNFKKFKIMCKTKLKTNLENIIHTLENYKKLFKENK